MPGHPCLPAWAVDDLITCGLANFCHGAGSSCGRLNLPIVQYLQIKGAIVALWLPCARSLAKQACREAKGSCTERITPPWCALGRSTSGSRLAWMLCLRSRPSLTRLSHELRGSTPGGVMRIFLTDATDLIAVSGGITLVVAILTKLFFRRRKGLEEP